MTQVRDRVINQSRLAGDHSADGVSVVGPRSRATSDLEAVQHGLAFVGGATDKVSRKQASKARRRQRFDDDVVTEGILAMSSTEHPRSTTPVMSPPPPPTQSTPGTTDAALPRTHSGSSGGGGGGGGGAASGVSPKVKAAVGSPKLKPSKAGGASGSGATMPPVRLGASATTATGASGGSVLSSIASGKSAGGLYHAGASAAGGVGDGVSGSSTTGVDPTIRTVDSGASTSSTQSSTLPLGSTSISHSLRAVLPAVLKRSVSNWVSPKPPPLDHQRFDQIHPRANSTSAMSEAFPRWVSPVAPASGNDPPPLRE